MISFDDCVALCGLSEEEVSAIAEHEHISEMIAAALASYLVHEPGGEVAIEKMIIDDIRAALAERRIEHASKLFAALRHFLSDHPHAC